MPRVARKQSEPGNGDDGDAKLRNCPKCDEVIVSARCDGVLSRLSRTSVPHSHAAILGLYYRCIWHVWTAASGRLLVSAWFPDYGPPATGRLYTQHDCSLRR